MAVYTKEPSAYSEGSLAKRYCLVRLDGFHWTNRANALESVNLLTNLDLLDSYTALSESKLALFKTKVDYSVNLYRLKIALGEQI